MTEKTTRIRIYLTLRCNRQCAYCVNRHNMKEFAGDRYEELPPAKWLKIVKRQPHPVVLTGGEPFLYAGLARLVGGIPETRPVHIYTNMTVSPIDFINRVQRPVGFLVSYHPKTITFGKLLEHLAPLMAHERFHGMVHTVDLPGHEKAVKEAASYFADASDRWKFASAEDQRVLNVPMTGQEKRRVVRCTRLAILVAPDGVRYPCASLLLRKRHPLEDLKVDKLKLRRVVVRCGDYGFCCPCDAAAPGSCVLV